MRNNKTMMGQVSTATSPLPNKTASEPFKALNFRKMTLQVNKNRGNNDFKQ